MSNKVAYKVDYKYSNNIDLLDTMLSVYSITYLQTPLSLREKEVLRAYIIDGYSPRTKRAIKISLKINDSNLNTLNFKLKQKGFLLNHPTNQKLKILNQDLSRIRDVFMDEDKNIMKLFIVNCIPDKNDDRL